VECNHLRRGGHAVVGRVRTLSRAALVAGLIVAGPARAELPAANRDALAFSGLTDPVSWWALPGRAAWLPDPDLMTAWPWTLGGFAVGGVGLDEPWGAPAAQPWPGLPGATAPLGAWDSMAVALPEGGVAGFGAPLATAAWQVLRAPRRTRATLSLGSGWSDFDDNSIAVERVDTLGSLGVLAESGTRGEGGGIASVGRHVWQGRAAVTRGRHRVEGAYAERGYGASLLGGENEDARAASGFLRWRFTGARAWGSAAWSRGWDERTSFGGRLLGSRRDAQENVAAVEGGTGVLRARAAWRSAEVRRQFARAFERRDRSWWGALQVEQRLGGGTGHVAVGGGRDDATGAVIAPEAAWSTRWRGLAARFGGSRLAVPVWSDLTRGQTPFRQDTWAGTLELQRDAGTMRAAVSISAGRTRARALLDPAPLDEQWLRSGAHADHDAYRFVLAVGQLTSSRGPFVGGVEGDVLGDGRTGPGAMPRGGGRGWLEARVRAFQGDLGMRLRVEGAGVGARRANDGTALPAYATLGAAASLTLGDAVLIVRATDLENTAHPEPWIDTVTGAPALSVRRQVRTTLTWRLYN
jgi:hypothetical protein